MLPITSLMISSRHFYSRPIRKLTDPSCDRKQSGMNTCNAPGISDCLVSVYSMLYTCTACCTRIPSHIYTQSCMCVTTTVFVRVENAVSWFVRVHGCVQDCTGLTTKLYSRNKSVGAQLIIDQQLYTNRYRVMLRCRLTYSLNCQW